MGTRSLTIFLDEEGEEICVMYRQFDGYPEGHGKDLHDFLDNMEVVNGFTSDMDVGTHANGMGCVAAQTIAHFKNRYGLGGIYIYPPGTRDVWEDFIYTISLKNDEQNSPEPRSLRDFWGSIGKVKIEMEDLYHTGEEEEKEQMKWRM